MTADNATSWSTMAAHPDEMGLLSCDVDVMPDARPESMVIATRLGELQAMHWAYPTTDGCCPMLPSVMSNSVCRLRATTSVACTEACCFSSPFTQL